jgi:hypothetical protein
MTREQLLEDLFRAYYEARKHKRNTVNQLRFEINFEQELFALADEILERRYELRPSICFVIDKPVKREIFAADFRDRVVHHLVCGYINPVFETQFIDDSYSCRKGKGTLYGIKRVANFVKECSENYTKDCYVLKLDIQGYFMSINKNILWRNLQEMLSECHCNDLRHCGLDPQSPEITGDCGFRRNDEQIQMIDYLLEKIIFNDPRCNCIIKGKRSDWDNLPKSKSLFYSPENCGLPIGNLTSQLFSNVYLHDFDIFMTKNLKLKYYGRYVDDFVIIFQEKELLKATVKKVKDYLSVELQLTLHPNKIYFQHYSKGFAFLGTYIKPHRIYIGNRTKKKFTKTVCEIETQLSQKLSPSRNDLEQVRCRINSYLGIMQHYQTYNIRKKILLDNNHLNLILQYGYLKVIFSKSMVYCLVKIVFLNATHF